MFPNAIVQCKIVWSLDGNKIKFRFICLILSLVPQHNEAAQIQNITANFKDNIRERLANNMQTCKYHFTFNSLLLNSRLQKITNKDNGI